MINKVLSKLPINVIVKTDITDSRVTIPSKLDPNALYKELKPSIDSQTLTTEKAAYIASTQEQEPYIDSIQMLNSKH